MKNSSNKITEAATLTQTTHAVNTETTIVLQKPKGLNRKRMKRKRVNVAPRC